MAGLDASLVDLLLESYIALHPDYDPIRDPALHDSMLLEVSAAKLRVDARDPERHRAINGDAIVLVAVVMIVDPPNLAPDLLISGEPDPSPMAVRKSGSPGADQTGICFTGETLVATAHGNVPIESIKAGDLVLSLDPITTRTGYFAVTDVFSHHVSSLIELKVANDVIHVTEEHPFWVSDKGWVRARELDSGDCLLTWTGRCNQVVSIQYILDDVWVHNFTVAQAHSYFVTNEHYLVHNQCYATRQNRTRPGSNRQREMDKFNRRTRSEQKTPLTVDMQDKPWSSFNDPRTMQQAVPGPGALGPGRGKMNFFTRWLDALRRIFIPGSSSFRKENYGET